MVFKKTYEPLAQALEELGYEQPLPKQKEFFSSAKSGAHTWITWDKGAGKTSTLCLAVVQLLQKAVEDIPRAILLAKDTDHGQELEQVLSTIARHTDLRVYHTYKGRDLIKDRDAIYMGMDVVIGTAQRLNEIYKVNGLNYRAVKVFGIDCADRILKPEVITQVDKFTDRLPPCQFLILGEKQTSGIQRFNERYLDRIKVL